MSMISFRPMILIIGISIGLLPLLSNWRVLAQNQSQNIELKVYSENEQKQSCPDKVKSQVKNLILIKKGVFQQMALLT